MSDTTQTKPTTLPDLRANCPDCDGNGGGRGWTCSTCEGKGELPTDAGKAMLEFLWQHLKASDLAR